MGAPEPACLEADPHTGLIALHLGAAFHRLEIVSAVVRYYAKLTHWTDADYPVLALLGHHAREDEARLNAMTCYELAIQAAPDLAEAHYGVARLFQMTGQNEAAVAAFGNVLNLAPHRQAPAGTHLHGNAHWERANLFEALERPDEALVAYRAALSAVPNFGVHHLRAARFLRRMGFHEEAVAHFRKCMTYSHRYFPEFMPPPLAPTVGLPATSIEPIYETSRGEIVVGWNGEYYAVPRDIWPLDLNGLAQPGATLQSSAIRRASSISALEP